MGNYVTCAQATADKSAQASKDAAQDAAIANAAGAGAAAVTPAAVLAQVQAMSPAQITAMCAKLDCAPTAVALTQSLLLLAGSNVVGNVLQIDASGNPVFNDVIAEHVAGVDPHTQYYDTTIARESTQGGALFGKCVAVKGPGSMQSARPAAMFHDYDVRTGAIVITTPFLENVGFHDSSLKIRIYRYDTQQFTEIDISAYFSTNYPAPRLIGRFASATVSGTWQPTVKFGLKNGYITIILGGVTDSHYFTSGAVDVVHINFAPVDITTGWSMEFSAAPWSGIDGGAGFGCTNVELTQNQTKTSYAGTSTARPTFGELSPNTSTIGSAYSGTLAVNNATSLAISAIVNGSGWTVGFSGGVATVSGNMPTSGNVTFTLLATGPGGTENYEAVVFGV